MGTVSQEAMRCNARVAFCILLSDRNIGTRGEQPLLAQRAIQRTAVTYHMQLSEVRWIALNERTLR